MLGIDDENSEVHIGDTLSSLETIALSDTLQASSGGLISTAFDTATLQHQPVHAQASERFSVSR
ncbi:MAG: hypothetical protein KDD62_10990, partial [Bdellovibrionales bacterium]|nr:hypothetical protein [Bdellovibrionales bacterium]